MIFPVELPDDGRATLSCHVTIHGGYAHSVHRVTAAESEEAHAKVEAMSKELYTEATADAVAALPEVKKVESLHQIEAGHMADLTKASKEAEALAAESSALALEGKVLLPAEAERRQTLQHEIAARREAVDEVRRALATAKVAVPRAKIKAFEACREKALAELAAKQKALEESLAKAAGPILLELLAVREAQQHVWTLARDDVAAANPEPPVRPQAPSRVTAPRDLSRGC